MTKPNYKNFCGGNFQDWLEVMLTSKCNGRCSFCIEKNGWYPKETVSWKELADAIIATNKPYIQLLGGEPTLYPDLKELIDYLNAAGRNVYLTTNGSKLYDNRFLNSLTSLHGLNVSIHHYNLNINEEITGINLSYENLYYAFQTLQRNNVKIRLNCNLINGCIDSKEEIFSYIEIAKDIKVDSVRFSELKNDDRFVDLTKIFGNQYGLNVDPFTVGCWQDAEINGMKVNFRQMCGLQTNKRICPKDPEQAQKHVMYYDGKVYAGWQTKGDDVKKNDKEIESILERVSKGVLSVSEGKTLLMTLLPKAEPEVRYVEKIVEKARERGYGRTGCGCQY